MFKYEIHHAQNMLRAEFEMTGLIDFRKRQAVLVLVLPGFIRVACCTDFIRLQEDELCDPLVRVDLCGERGGVRDFKGDLAAPFGFERGDIDDQSAACVSGFADAQHEDIARDVEPFNGLAQREGVGRDDDMVGPTLGGVDADHKVVGKLFGINDRDATAWGSRGEDLELGADADVVAVGGNAVGDGAFAFDGFLERLDVNLGLDLGVT